MAVEVGTSRSHISSIFKFILFCQNGVRNLDLDFPEWKKKTKVSYCQRYKGCYGHAVNSGPGTVIASADIPFG